MRSLYEIGADLELLEQLLTDIEGEIPEGEIGEKLEAFMAGLEYERDEKVRRFCALIEMMGFAAEACAEEARRLERLKRANENGAQRLKNRLKLFFEQHAIPKLDLKIFKPRIQANGGVRPLIFPPEWEQEPANAPEAFHKIIVALDTLAIRETVEAFYAQAERVTASAKDEHERCELFKQWIESDEEARKTKELIEGCSIAPRGTHLRLR